MHAIREPSLIAKAYLSVIAILAAITTCITLNCTSTPPTRSMPWQDEFIINEYEIQELQWSERWYNWMHVIPLEPDFPHDIDGVILSYFNGDYYYHPYQVSAKGLEYLASYRETSDDRYLEKLDIYTGRLLADGVRANGGIYFPYPFNYRLHAGNENEVMLAPWYSGFAQGVALSLFSRIYEETGDEHSLAIADSVFATFLPSTADKDPWTVFIDSARYYWIEEYPFMPPERVYNGFLIAVMGLYDYYLQRHDSRTATLIMASCTTIADYFDEFRNPGGISSYCLSHRTPLASYHTLVVQLLRQIAKVANDSTFDSMADTLMADYWPE